MLKRLPIVTDFCATSPGPIGDLVANSAIGGNCQSRRGRKAVATYVWPGLYKKSTKFERIKESRLYIKPRSSSCVAVSGVRFSVFCIKLFAENDSRMYSGIDPRSYLSRSRQIIRYRGTSSLWCPQKSTLALVCVRARVCVWVCVWRGGGGE